MAERKAAAPNEQAAPQKVEPSPSGQRHGGERESGWARGGWVGVRQFAGNYSANRATWQHVDCPVLASRIDRRFGSFRRLNFSPRDRR